MIGVGVKYVHRQMARNACRREEIDGKSNCLFKFFLLRGTYRSEDFEKVNFISHGAWGFLLEEGVTLNGYKNTLY